MSEHERLTPEEYKKMEGITPELEEARQHHLLPDALEERDRIAEKVDIELDNLAEPWKFREVMENEGLTPEQEEAEAIQELVDAASAVYQKIGDLVRGQTGSQYAVASQEAQDVWESLSQQNRDYGANTISGEQYIGALKVSLATLVRIQEHLKTGK